MRAAADVNWLRDGAHQSVTFRADVVGVYLEPNGRELCRIYVRERTERCGGFRERHGCAAVQQTERLAGTVIHRHRRNHARRRELVHFDAERVGHPSGGERAKPGEFVGVVRHGESYTGRHNTQGGAAKSGIAICSGRPVTFRACRGRITDGSEEGYMQRRISKIGRYAVPGFCALALGACFHPAPQEAPVPAGSYGGTVVAYPVGGYGYDPYADYYGYGYAPYGYLPYGLPYGYGYPGYAYARPPVIVRVPAYGPGVIGRGSVSNPHEGQYGLRPWGGMPRVGRLRPPASPAPVPPATTGRIAHPRPVMPSAPRPTVNQKPSVPPQRVAVPRPAPRPEQRPDRRH
jgi:hypothetical protein